MPATTSGSVQKLFSPSSLLRPVPGLPPQQSQLQVRIQNNGSLYLNRLVVTDTDADFFDAVDWVGPLVVNAPPGANRARLEVCTTGCAAARSSPEPSSPSATTPSSPCPPASPPPTSAASG